MADKIRLRVVTPSRLMLDDVVDEVTAPGALGEFGVLPNHIAFLTLSLPGEMSYKEGAARHYLAISGGYAEVLDNVMTVLAPAAEFASEIDASRAERAKALRKIGWRKPTRCPNSIPLKTRFSGRWPGSMSRAKKQDDRKRERKEDFYGRGR